MQVKEGGKVKSESHTRDGAMGDGGRDSHLILLFEDIGQLFNFFEAGCEDQDVATLSRNPSNKLCDCH